MSATMDVDLFSCYFDSAPVYYIEGRTYPIEVNIVGVFERNSQYFKDISCTTTGKSTGTRLCLQCACRCLPIAS